MGIFKRPSMGDRMDRAQERNDRRKQTTAQRDQEIAFAKDWDRNARIGKYKADLKKKYK